MTHESAIPPGRHVQIPGRYRLHIIERLRRIGPNDIDYQFTVDNPTMYTRQWTATLPMRREKGMIYEYACHEGNHALPNVLAGFRFQESEAK